ncbi:aspartyl protease family protein [Pedobacter sp. MW01-1-1]|uniref:aspartyl protease family protein n=1 Tax=Pedobacter sp. MW01-1-1 TaxID=3383027 RepID=UPI003FEDD6A1
MRNSCKKILFLAVFAFTATSFAQAQSKKLVEQLNAVFKEKSAEPIQSALSPDFSIASTTHQSAQHALTALAKQYPCDSIVHRNETIVDKTKKIEVLFYPSGKKAFQSAIYTDLAGKILYVDAFDQLYGMNRYKTSILRAKFPFEIIDNSIVLTLKLNDIKRPLKFLFDTGADGMAISEAMADSIGLKATRKQKASVVGGVQEIAIAENNTIHLDTFSFKNQNIAIFKETHKGTDGLIGNSIAKRYITKVDFDKKEISLYDFGDYKNTNEGISVPITSPNGLFIIKGTLNVKPETPYDGEFVFDTGAGYSLICFRPFVRQNKLLVSGFKPDFNSTTQSMGMITPTYTGHAESFAFGPMQPIHNFGVTLMAGGGQSESWNPGFDGSIGIKLINRYNFTINMQKKEIFMSPNKSYTNPFDFVLGDYLLGFNDKQQLIVQSIIKPGENKLMQEGDQVEKINGTSAESLFKTAKKIDALKNLPEQSSVKIEYISKGTKKTGTLLK